MRTVTPKNIAKNKNEGHEGVQPRACQLLAEYPLAVPVGAVHMKPALG